MRLGHPRRFVSSTRSTWSRSTKFQWLPMSASTSARTSLACIFSSWRIDVVARVVRDLLDARLPEYPPSKCLQPPSLLRHAKVFPSIGYLNKSTACGNLILGKADEALGNDHCAVGLHPEQQHPPLCPEGRPIEIDVESVCGERRLRASLMWSVSGCPERNLFAKSCRVWTGRSRDVRVFERTYTVWHCKRVDAIHRELPGKWYLLCSFVLSPSDLWFRSSSQSRRAFC